MNRLILSTAFVGLLTAALLPQGAAAQDTTSVTTADGAFTFVGGVGYTFLRGNELVYDDFGNRISQLVWESQAPVVTAGATGRFGNGWTVSGDVTYGGKGNSFMSDRDWLDPFVTSFGDDDWTDRSLHPDTDLDRYLDLNIAVGHDFRMSDAVTINLNGGFKYTDVKWTAYGGSFVYSNAGYRDSAGDFPDGERGITFEQRYPAVFIGANAVAKSGAWTFTGTLKGGVTVNASDTDNHWLRDLRFEEDYDSSPFISVGARADYAFNERMSVFVGGTFDNYFRKKGDTTIYDIPTGAEGPTFPDGAGMDFRSLTLTTGVKVGF